MDKSRRALWARSLLLLAFVVFAVVAGRLPWWADGLLIALGLVMAVVSWLNEPPRQGPSPRG
ncbi:MAG: hypothetical protein KY391_00005 [Actinobacteria bacterium]|nr:hypothetical protein [Actinomycetota bacterium]